MVRYKKFIYILLVVCIFPLHAFSQSFSIDNIKDIKTNCANCFVSNQDGILSPNTVEQINTILSSLEKQTTAEILVVAIKDIGDNAARDVAMELFDKWKIGKAGKDNGTIIILALDKREVFIRTGYGLEGALTDAKSTSIVNKIMIPYFKKGDWDQGMVAGVKEVASIVANEYNVNGFEGAPKKQAKDYSFIIYGYLIISLIVLIISIIDISKSTRGFSNEQKEEKIDAFTKASFGWKIAGVLFPIVLLFVVIWYSVFFKPSVRKSKINCRKCGDKMHLLNEKEDDEFLSNSQVMEENIRSKNYDVWLCKSCGNTDIFSYNNTLTQYTTCDNCGAKTVHQTGDNIVVNPTAFHEGAGEKVYTCKNCGKVNKKRYSIPKGATIAAGGVILGSGMGRGGGGFSGGGSWGGGMSGGGGGGGSF